MRLPLFHQRKTAPWLVVAKAVIVAMPLLLVVRLLNDHIFFTPSLSYSYRPGRYLGVVRPGVASSLINTADPALRWKITTDSFPFTITVPRLIEAVRVRLRLDPGTQPYVALNVSGKKGGGFSTIVSAQALDTLSWTHISNGNLTLWMRDKHSGQTSPTKTGTNGLTTMAIAEEPLKQYASLKAFRADPPAMSSLGLVGIDRMSFASVTNYTPSSTPVSLGHTLRGSHQLYVYAAHETLRLTFDKIDLNRSVGTDGVTVRVANVANLITGRRIWLTTVNVGDDGISGKSGPRGRVQPVVVTIPNIAPGIYFIDIHTSEDVLLANLTSSQHYLSFTNRIFIAEGPSYGQPSFSPVTLITNGATVALAASHDQGKQDVTVGSKKYSIQDVKVKYNVSELKGETKITVPKGDATISSDGLLSFIGTTLLPDGARNVDVSSATPDFSSFDYILADYVPRARGPLSVDQLYQLSDLTLTGKTITMSVDAPGIQARSTSLGLKDIRATLFRGPFPWRKVWDKLGLSKK